MQLRPRRIVFHVFLLIAVLVLLSAVAIWLGLGRAVHSEGLAADISN